MSTAAAPAGDTAVYQPPVLSSDVTQFYLTPGKPVPAGADLEYVPKVLGFAEVTYPVDRRKGIENAASFRAKDCSRFAFWLAASIAAYWSFALGMFILEIGLALK